MKKAVKSVRGVYNMSGLFLATTSEALVVTKKTGISRSVMYVPRIEVSKEVILRLDKCKPSVIVHITMIMHCYYCVGTIKASPVIKKWLHHWYTNYSTNNTFKN